MRIGLNPTSGVAAADCTTHETIKFIRGDATTSSAACLACLALCNTATDFKKEGSKEKAACAIACATGPLGDAAAFISAAAAKSAAVKSAATKASILMFKPAHVARRTRRESSAAQAPDPCDYANDGSCDVPFFCDTVRPTRCHTVIASTGIYALLS